ncbi:hypothetical protein [Motilimonas eburnea]|uniref:hypothetical protein n=1 Tax=Motilimonas eburnea TaxID=1737488 RepID=UPI0032E045C3
MKLSILSKYCSTTNKTLLAESVGQRLLVISTALAPFRVGDYATKPLPGINTQQIAAKTSTKDQQALIDAKSGYGLTFCTGPVTVVNQR